MQRGWLYGLVAFEIACYGLLQANPSLRVMVANLLGAAMTARPDNILPNGKTVLGQPDPK
jgi:hypothetical protein